MSGNVWEWCRDFYDSQFYNSFPQSLMNVHEAQTVSLRGGSWANKKGGCGFLIVWEALHKHGMIISVSDLFRKKKIAKK